MNALFRLLTVAPLLGLVLSGRPAAAQERAPEGGRKLTVSSNATILADPDAAVITFAATATGPTTREAREGADKRIKAIKDGITNLKLTGLTIEVVPTPLNLLVAAVPGPDGSHPTQGFHAQSQFSVTLREKDKEKLRDMVVRVGDVVVENGGIGPPDERAPRLRLPARLGGIGGGGAEPPEKAPGPSVEWLCENDSQARQKAVRKAVDEALASARVIAEPANLKVTEVEVQQALPTSRIRFNLSEGAVLDSGRVPIKVTVKVTCSY